MMCFASVVMPCGDIQPSAHAHAHDEGKTPSQAPVFLLLHFKKGKGERDNSNYLTLLR